MRSRSTRSWRAQRHITITTIAAITAPSAGEALCLRYFFGQTLEQLAGGLDCSPDEAAALDRQALEALTGVSLSHAA